MLNIITYTLPAYWATYLINGDDSGISDEDKQQCDSFLSRERLTMPVSCSDESWFSWHNDSGNNLGGDVMEYVFLIPCQDNHATIN